MRIQIESLDLDQIYESGQCFRWRRIEPGLYEIPSSGHFVQVRQMGAVFDLSCDESEFTTFWRSYFDLDTDYERWKAQIDLGDTCLCRAAEYGRGMRILRQDLWEILISFLIGQNNNIPRIRTSLNALCALTQGRFPELQEVAALENATLRELGLGYRRSMSGIQQSIMETSHGVGNVARHGDRRGQKGAFGTKGIGPKVADCICLYGLHRMDSFPMDTHMRQVVALYYPEGFFSRYEGCAGLMQQYLFYYHLKKPEATVQIPAIIEGRVVEGL
ncbi:MAG: DNA-3-methyladenine glycosylase family protein [Clostridia bacterium]